MKSYVTKKKSLVGVCTALVLALPPLALAMTLQERVGALSPATVKEIIRSIQPEMNRETLRLARPRPEAADLMVHPIQVEKLAPRNGLLRFRVFVPISNIGKASSIGVVVKLMGIDAATGRERLSTSARIAALPGGEMSGFGSVVGIEDKASVVARHFSRLWVVIEPSDRRRTTTYSDANNTNNTAQLSGDELVRKLGL